MTETWYIQLIPHKVIKRAYIPSRKLYNTGRHSLHKCCRMIPDLIFTKKCGVLMVSV